ncbi:MAG: TetR/AcrR family transcriptional regulator [Streptomyces sp.]|nr:TetR/AcrR family transcriptional regulator [Streptomyces sp.]NUT24738.1 TetR/AcrR family transcriptional regulator [Streptomyces sp.]
MAKSSAPSPGAPSRDRIVAGAADLISRRGLKAASIREVAKHAKAPLGSTYHYFPEGKQQLATEAVRYAGAAVSGILRKQLDAGPVAGLRAFLALWRGIVVESDFRAGCPVLAVSVEEPPADEVPPALAAAAEAFRDWERLLTETLRTHGADAERAPGLAALIVASVEGAIAMSRAKRSMEPLDQVAEQLEALIVGVCGPA